MFKGFFCISINFLHIRRWTFFGDINNLTLLGTLRKPKTSSIGPFRDWEDRYTVSLNHGFLCKSQGCVFLILLFNNCEQSCRQKDSESSSYSLLIHRLSCGFLVMSMFHAGHYLMEKYNGLQDWWNIVLFY